MSSGFTSFHITKSLLRRLNAEPWLCWLHPSEFPPLTSVSEMLLRGHLCLYLLVSQIRQIAMTQRIPEFENTVSGWWFHPLKQFESKWESSSSSGEHKKYVSNHLPVLSWLSLLFLFNQLPLLAIEGRVNQRTEVWNTVIISSGLICAVSKPAASVPNMPLFPWENTHLHRSKGGSTFPTAWDLEWL